MVNSFKEKAREVQELREVKKGVELERKKAIAEELQKKVQLRKNIENTERKIKQQKAYLRSQTKGAKIKKAIQTLGKEIKKNKPKKKKNLFESNF